MASRRLLRSGSRSVRTLHGLLPFNYLMREFHGTPSTLGCAQTRHSDHLVVRRVSCDRRARWQVRRGTQGLLRVARDRVAGRAEPALGDRRRGRRIGGHREPGVGRGLGHGHRRRGQADGDTVDGEVRRSARRGLREFAVRTDVRLGLPQPGARTQPLPASSRGAGQDRQGHRRCDRGHQTHQQGREGGVRHHHFRGCHRRADANRGHHRR